jgi:ketosteroid isomerase-like protein
MNTLHGDRRTTVGLASISRRSALRGLGAAGFAAFAVAIPAHVAADDGDRIANALFAPASGDDPATLIADYVAAVNAGDLEGILALYNDDAFHIMLPSADGSAGVCVGKEQFRMWYEMSLANGERMTVDEDTVTVDGNQATFVALLTSEPWRKLGVETLEATSEIVVIDGRIATHVVALTPESVRELQAARGGTA